MGDPPGVKIAKKINPRGLIFLAPGGSYKAIL